MPLVFTPLMKKRLTHRAQTMIERSLPYFPELQGKLITVGLTRKHLGSASIGYRAGAITRLIIRLKVRNVTYQTIRHELTHPVQALARGDPWIPSAAAQHKVPADEKQGDISNLE